MTATLAPITVGTKLIIQKGCRAREIPKGLTAIVREVTPLGADYSHSVKVVLWFQNGFVSGKTFVFFARHPNRLQDAILSLNDGNPTHRVEARRA